MNFFNINIIVNWFILINIKDIQSFQNFANFLDWLCQVEYLTWKVLSWVEFFWKSVESNWEVELKHSSWIEKLDLITQLKNSIQFNKILNKCK